MSAESEKSLGRRDNPVVAYVDVPGGVDKGIR